MNEEISTTNQLSRKEGGMPKRDGTGSPSGARGTRNGRGGGNPGRPGAGTGSKTGGRKGSC